MAQKGAPDQLAIPHFFFPLETVLGTVKSLTREGAGASLHIKLESREILRTE